MLINCKFKGKPERRTLKTVLENKIEEYLGDYEGESLHVSEGFQLDVVPELTQVVFKLLGIDEHQQGDII
jgi:adenylyl- and sulfurtransferase ThiI